MPCEHVAPESTAEEEKAANNSSTNRTEQISTNAPRPLAISPQMSPSNFKEAEKCERGLGYLESLTFLWLNLFPLNRSLAHIISKSKELRALLINQNDD